MSESQKYENRQPIPGYGGGYSITRSGKVWSHKRGGQYLTPIIIKGYSYVDLYNPKRKRVLVHHLVARVYLGPKPDSARVEFKNGDKSDLSPENLQYVIYTPASVFHDPSLRAALVSSISYDMESGLGEK